MGAVTVRGQEEVGWTLGQFLLLVIPGNVERRYWKEKKPNGKVVFSVYRDIPLPSGFSPKLSSRKVKPHSQKSYRKGATPVKGVGRITIM